MAPMKVIGASLGRCGTDSLRVALDILGYKTHHMKCFFEDPSLDPQDFLDAYNNRDTADWDKLYRNYDACTDWTASTFYKDLFQRYPDAKVILTVRPVDGWYESVKNTIFKSAQLMPIETLDKNDPVYPFKRLAHSVCMDGHIREPEKFADEDKIKQMFKDHIEEVKRIIPTEQLCVLELGDGWEKICQFLGKEVPQLPYPRVNSTFEFEQYFINGENPSKPDALSTI